MFLYSSVRDNSTVTTNTIWFFNRSLKTRTVQFSLSFVQNLKESTGPEPGKFSLIRAAVNDAPFRRIERCVMHTNELWEMASVFLACFSRQPRLGKKCPSKFTDIFLNPSIRGLTSKITFRLEMKTAQRRAIQGEQVVNWS